MTVQTAAKLRHQHRAVFNPAGIGLAMIVAVIALSTPSSALAGSWIEVSCPSTSQAAASSPGWSSFAGISPGKYDGASTVCGGSQSMRAWLASFEAAHMFDSQTLEFQPPAGSTLDGGWLQMGGLAAGHGPNGYAEVGLYAGTLGGTPFWSCAYEACPQGTKDMYIGPVNIPAGTGGGLWVGVICNGGSGAKCQEGDDSVVWAEVEVKEAHLLLSNDASPNANGFGGSLLEPNARGTQELDVTATDLNGPGVYSVTVEIEGTVAYSGTPNTNGGACVPTGSTNTGVMMFTSPQPCLQTEAVKLPVETAGVLDGQHSVKVAVTDAARNTTSVFVGDITTHNAPVASTSPSILAPNGVSTGVALSSTPGQWSAPAGAGSITDVYQWELCSPTGTACQAIPGATTATYSPVPADAGHTFKLAVTGVNADGQATTESAATGVVATATGSVTSGDSPSSEGIKQDPSVLLPEPGAPNGTNATASATIQLAVHRTISRRYTKTALSIPGKLVNATGQPIAGATIEVLGQTVGTSKPMLITHATTGVNGTFTVTVSAGPSRVIELAYRAFANATAYAAQARLTESVSAEVLLHINSKRTRPTGTITLSGRVAGPIPTGGVNLELEVFYHGHWVAFHAPHTRPDGRFTLHYQFQGATGQFPFRVKALAGQNGFAYSTGRSRSITVVAR